MCNGEILMIIWVSGVTLVIIISGKFLRTKRKSNICDPHQTVNAKCEPHQEQKNRPQLRDGQEQSSLGVCNERQLETLYQNIKK